VSLAEWCKTFRRVVQIKAILFSETGANTLPTTQHHGAGHWAGYSATLLLAFSGRTSLIKS
jgi:hypothetical protein